MSIKKLMPHNGDIIASILAKNKMTNADLAREIGKSRPCITHYLKEPSLQARTLWKITQETGFDCFTFLSNAVNETDEESHTMLLPASLAKEKEALEERVKNLEKELAIYKEIVMGRG